MVSCLCKTTRKLVLLLFCVLAALFLALLYLQFLQCHELTFLFWLKCRSKTRPSLSCRLGILFESKSIPVSNYFIKAAFKTKMPCYHLVHHVTRMFSYITYLYPLIAMPLPYIIVCIPLLSCNFS